MGRFSDNRTHYIFPEEGGHHHLDTNHGRLSAQPLESPRGDERLLWSLHTSEQYVLWLAAADEIGLFNILDAAPASAAEVAHTLHIGMVAAEGLLGVLAALGFLGQYDGRYSLTQTARDFLLPSSAFYRGAWLAVVRRRPRLTYGMIYTALREDGAIYPHYWERSEGEFAQAGEYVRALHTTSFVGAPALAERGDFSQVHRLLDVGGGAGGMSIALALRYPALRCTVLDHASTCAVAAEYSAAHGVSERVDTCAADAFADPWPDGYDAILFSNVLNCFNAQGCQALIQKAYEYLPRGGCLYIHEMPLYDGKDGPLGIVALSLYDHLGSRGQQWTAGEVTAMLTNAGFTLAAMTPTYAYNVLFSAIKPR